MKKLILPVILVAALAGFAGAQTSKKPVAAPTQIACAVMPSNKVDIAKATKAGMFADYKGNRYFFCCGGCPDAFKKDSAKYAKGAHIKTPKAPKTAK
jgi:YHS domain-containing protein